MKPKKRRNLSGPFVPQLIGKALWRLARTSAAPIDIFLAGVDPAGADILQRATVSDIDIEWRSDAVRVHLTADGQPRVFHTQGAILHEPLAGLYESLPLASFDRKAQRFWRRVFFLTRIPGGRALLRVLARRTRNTKKIRDTDHTKR